MLASFRSAARAGVVAAIAIAGPAAGAAGEARPLRSVQAPEAGAEGPATTASAAEPPARWITLPPALGRLRAPDLGVVINDADPYSVAVGERYVQRRGIDRSRVLRVTLPVVPRIDAATFDALRARVDAHFGPRVQALALAWRMPYAVACHSIGGALALGFEPAFCLDPCGPTGASPYFGAPTDLPFTAFGMRLSMLLAAPDEATAFALIDRGLAADGALHAAAPGAAAALLQRGTDARRDVRRLLYPPAGATPGSPVRVQHAAAGDWAAPAPLLLVQAGTATLALPAALRWAPGALADHLTSFGGRLSGDRPQSTVLEWIASGATASHGTVSEPCNHVQKFPHPQVLLLAYTQGLTAIEAYWKSVAWPRQSLFVGEPLAAPFAPPAPFTAPFAPPAQPTAPFAPPAQFTAPASP
jgi:uncharacterized protein (TIGR03790 family)